MQAYITRMAAGIVMVIGAAVASVWFFGKLYVTGLAVDFKPMAPATAVCCILLGMGLLPRPKKTAFGRAWSFIAISSALVISLLIAAEFVVALGTGTHADFERLLVPAMESGPGFTTGRMSPLTALFMITLAIGMLGWRIHREQGRKPPAYAQLLAGVTLLMGLLFTIGYWYGVPLLYDGTNLPPSLPTAAALLLLSIALLFDGPDAFFSRLMSSQTILSRIVRVITPLTVVIILVVGRFMLWATSAFIERHDAVQVYVIAILSGAATVLATVLVSRHVQQNMEKAVDALRASEHKFRTMISTSQEGIISVDDREIITFVNARMAEMLGYAPEDMHGRPLSTFVHEEEQEQYEQQRKLRSLGQATQFDRRYRRKDGSVVWTHVSATPQFDDAQKFIGSFGMVMNISERKQVDERIAESERKYRTLFESSSDGIFVLDLAGNFLDINKTAYTRLGYTREEMLALPINKLDSPEFAAQVPKRLARIRDRGHAVFESAHIRKDGSIMPVEVNARLLEYKGSLVYFSVIRDITERKKAEVTLRESENKYRTIIETSNEMFWMLDREGRFTYVNKKSGEVSGYTVEELLGKDFAPLIPVKDNDRISSIFFDVLCGKPRHYEVDVIRKDGSVITLSVNSAPVYSGDAVVSAISFGQDITERKRAEQELRKSEERYRGMFDDSPIAVWEEDFSAVKARFDVLRASGVADLRAYLDSRPDEIAAFAGLVKVLAINSASVKLLGAATKEQVLRNLPAYFNDESLMVFKEELLALAEGNNRFAGELPVLDVHGNQKMLDLTLSVQPGHEHALSSVLVSFLDITERKNAEEGQRKLEEQLRQAQKMEAIGTLAGGVAHDFNNILTAIAGYAHLIATDATLDELHQGYAKEIVTSTERASNLTRSLLAFSRKQRVDLRPVNINEIVFGFKKMLSRMIGEDIEFSVNLAVDDMVIEADRGQIEQVLMNLVANARDAMPKGGQLIIQTQRVDLEETNLIAGQYIDPGRYVIILVLDSGMGMRPEVIQHIFEPFFTTKEVGKGTGLGLSMVYGIVKKHNGFITVSSDLGVGTTFRIYLPLIMADQREDAEPEFVELPTGSETVLLVEDEATVRELMTRVLSKYGYTTIEATNGDEAIELFRMDPSRVDLVISDVIMPGKNGKEVYDILRTIRPDIKVLFISGYEGEILSNTGVMEPRFTCLPKPVYPADLARKVREVLDGQSAGSLVARHTIQESGIRGE